MSWAESDKIVKDWIKLRIDFDAVAREQYSKKDKDFDQSELYTKIKVRGGKYVRVYSIDALYGHIDALWKENKIKYSTLALMAWVYLSRELSSCLQERVFSSAGFTGNKLRITTDDDRAEKLALGCVNKDVHIYLKKAKKQFH